MGENVRLTAAHRRLRIAEARIAELEAALEPFAVEADLWVEMGETRPIYSLPALDNGGPTVGDLRRARALINNEAGNEQA